MVHEGYFRTDKVNVCEKRMVGTERQLTMVMKRRWRETAAGFDLRAHSGCIYLILTQTSSWMMQTVCTVSHFLIESSVRHLMIQQK
jgi:predicted cupin superfamily sugar epimerase